jgi:hypothetical protein
MQRYNFLRLRKELTDLDKGGEWFSFKRFLVII